MGLKMPGVSIGCQSGLPLKESFVSPSSWVHVATFSFTTFFPSFQVCHSVMSVSAVCAGTRLNMRQQCVHIYTCIYIWTFLQRVMLNCVKGISGQLHSLISLFSLVSFTVKIERNRISLTEQQIDTKDGEKGTQRDVRDGERVFFREPQVHEIRSRCVSRVSVAG